MLIRDLQSLDEVEEFLGRLKTLAERVGMTYVTTSPV